MDTKTCLKSFKTWLTQKSYSLSTIRNYLADLNRYLSFSKTKDIFSPDIINRYLTSLKTDKNKNRYISSLNKFFQFSLDQKLISKNPLKTIKKQNRKNESNILSIEKIVDLYKTHLNKKNFSATTIKNYLNDIQQFIDWNQSNSES